MVFVSCVCFLLFWKTSSSFFGPLWSTSPGVLKADSLEELLFPQPAYYKQGAVLPKVCTNIAQIVPVNTLQL